MKKSRPLLKTTNTTIYKISHIPQHHRIHAFKSSSQTSQQSQSPPLTFEEVQTIALSKNIDLSLKTIGPFYRIVCRDTSSPDTILAMTNGFLMTPLRLMHCDTLQIFTRGIQTDTARQAQATSFLGLGLLLGGATFAYGLSCGCTKAEILAINDDDAWHRRLVAYYSRFGFEPVVEVMGGRLSDLPHMLVWGGTGTRMDADIPAMLNKWQRSIRRSNISYDSNSKR
jgi:hypothetical protein